MFAPTVMRRWPLLAATLVLAGWAGLNLAEEPRPEPPKPEPAKPRNIVDVAKEADNLKTFCKLLESAGLVETLREKGPFTVLVPSDDAFKQLGKQLEELQKPENKAKLQRVLRNHVVEGRHALSAVKAMKSIKTAAGEELKVSVKDDVVMIEKAKVIKADTTADNGVIHIVDTVLVPAEPPVK